MANTTSLYSATVIREEVGLSLDKAGSEVLGHAAKVVLTKETTTIVGDGSTQEAVNKRVAQIKNLVEVCVYFIYIIFCFLIRCFFNFSCISITLFAVQAADQDYEKEKLSERIAKLSGGVAVIQVISCSGFYRVLPLAMSY